MTNQAAVLRRKTDAVLESMASYSGLEVQILERMKYCSLICYQNQEFIVSTEDLQGISPANSF